MRRNPYSANIDPTERSMPPTMTTSAMPSTMKPISPACRAVSARLAGERKFGNGTAQAERRRSGAGSPEWRFRSSAWTGFRRADDPASSGIAGEVSVSRIGIPGCGWRNWSGAVSRLETCGPERASTRRSRGYFLRSHRFQQAVWLSAFSLVIGISVVYIRALDRSGLGPRRQQPLDRSPPSARPGSARRS